MYRVSSSCLFPGPLSCSLDTLNTFPCKISLVTSWVPSVRAICICVGCGCDFFFFFLSDVWDSADQGFLWGFGTCMCTEEIQPPSATFPDSVMALCVWICVTDSYGVLCLPQHLQFRLLQTGRDKFYVQYTKELRAMCILAPFSTSSLTL